MVRFADLDTETALRAGSTVPAHTPDSWPITAQAIWTAQHLGMPIITRARKLYEGHPVTVTEMP
ncbi:MAG: hypothetical protein QOE54_1343 [Streptosporangiaceae bacterium]|nr:hypothetical protein [Streptosporangiaceae bacterium]MDX6428977.1 hypothetical protein [Streptosporangiaceae bacterium]